MSNKKYSKKKDQNQLDDRKGEERDDRRNTKSNNTSNSRNNRTNRNSAKSNVASDKHARNDLSWYAPTPEMLLASCSLPFSNRLLYSVKLGDLDAITPGIAALKLETSICSGKYIGVTDQYYTDDAINVVAKNIYSYIRRANSGAKTYEAVDLMQYLLTCDQAFMLWSYLVRLYGIARTYQFTNSYYPNQVLRAMGIAHPEGISGNLAQLNYIINNMAIRMSNLAVPKSMPYFLRHMWIYQNIFLDRPNPKAQSFIFTPNSYYVYTESTPDAKPAMIRKDFPTFKSGIGAGEILSQVQNLINEILDPITQSETLADTIPGDILKAYGQENLFAFPQLPADYTITPIYAEEIMPEISNLVICHIKNGDIKQTSTNFLYQNVPDYPLTSTSIDFVSIPKTIVSPEDVMYATRLLPAMRKADSEHAVPAKLTTGSEYVYQIDIYSGDSGVYTMTDSTFTIPFTANGTMAGSEVEPIIDVAKLSFLTSAFDWFPRIYLKDAKNTKKMYVNMDMDNFTTIDFDTIDRIHQTAFAGMFGLAYTLFKA